MNNSLKGRLSIGVFCVFMLAGTVWLAPAYGQNQENSSAETEAAPNDQQLEKAKKWVNDLQLNDPKKEKRLQDLIATHLTDVRNWHNSHSYTLTPAGINPSTGKLLSQLERQVIVDSAIPDSVHQNLMKGLHADLNKSQVEAVLDKYTVGKVAFTLKGYHAIVPDLTRKEEQVILNYLKQAREQAIDYKNMKEISFIFGIYKDKCEYYLNMHGRNWRELYQAYYDKVHHKK